MRAMSLHIGPPRMSGRSVSEPHSSFASLRRHFTRIFTASNWQHALLESEERETFAPNMFWTRGSILGPVE